MLSLSWLSLFLWTGLLFLIWPIPHTIALRHALLGVGLMGLAFAWRTMPWQRISWPPLAFWLAFVIWTLVQVVGWAIAPEKTANEIAGQLLPATAAGAMGIALGSNAARRGHFHSLLAIILAALAIHMSATIAESMRPIFEGDPLLRRVGGLTEGPDKSNYMTMVFIAWLMTEAWMRMQDKRLLPLPTILLVPVSLLAGVTLYVEQIRNGVVSLLAAVGALVLLGVFRKKVRWQGNRRAGLGILALGFLIVGFSLNDPRWGSTWQSLQQAWQADSRATVLAPELKGTKDASAFLRLAMLREGITQVVRHPWGVGFHRNAFGLALKDSYGQGSGHSHSSLVDVAIGTGIFGLILMVGFFYALLHIAWQRARSDDNEGLGVFLLLLVVMTLVRAMLDSSLRDHMLQETLLLIGLLLGAMAVSSHHGVKP